MEVGSLARLPDGALPARRDLQLSRGRRTVPEGIMVRRPRRNAQPAHASIRKATEGAAVMTPRDALYLPRHEVVTIAQAVTRAVAYGTVADTFNYSGEFWRYELDQRTALARALATTAWETRRSDEVDYGVFRMGLVFGARERVERDLDIERLELTQGEGA